MQGYEQPKILKLPQGEMRWAPRRLPVDVGDVMMNIRMDDAKHRFVGESISKYAQGLNPYGEWGYPYKVNKNNIRPPILDPKFYASLSRMPVKFDSVTAGPIVKDLYGKRAEIAKVAPKTIIDRVCPDAAPVASQTNAPSATDTVYRDGEINLHVRQPHASIPYHPSIPVHLNTGVPQWELDSKIHIRPRMGIHAPYNISDQSRDVNNMRTPMHVAVKPGYKDPYTVITQQQAPVDLPPPKTQTSAWYNPGYNLTRLSGHSIGEVDTNCLDNKVQTSAQTNGNYSIITTGNNDIAIRTANPVQAAGRSNISSRMLSEGELGDVTLPNSLQLGEFGAKAGVSRIQPHQEYARTANPLRANGVGYASTGAAKAGFRPGTENFGMGEKRTGIRSRLQVQGHRDNRTGLAPVERVNPVGTGRFIQGSF